LKRDDFLSRLMEVGLRLSKSNYKEGSMVNVKVIIDRNGEDTLVELRKAHEKRESIKFTSIIHGEAPNMVLFGNGYIYCYKCEVTRKLDDYLRFVKKGFIDRTLGCEQIERQEGLISVEKEQDERLLKRIKGGISGKGVKKMLKESDGSIVKIVKAKAGSGKTVSALDVVLNDDRPCLILAPFNNDCKTIEGTAHKIFGKRINRQYGDREDITFHEPNVHNVMVMTYNTSFYP